MKKRKRLITSIRWNSDKLSLMLLFLIAFFFRFYRLHELQFWSTDEELISHFAKKIVSEHKIFLISPNYTIAASLGSAFHMFTGFMYSLVDLDPIKQFTLGSLLGIVTTYLLYLIGKDIKSKWFGLLCGFFYACSFLVSLYDRRWWTLTVAPFFTALAVFAIVRMLRGKTQYSTLLALSIVTAWQIDPNLGIIPVAALVCWIFLKLPLNKQHFISAAAIIVLSFIPLIVFEIRHPGMLTSPLIKQVTERFGSNTNTISVKSNSSIILWRVLEVYAQYLVAAPTNQLDANFNWISEVKPWFSPIPEILILVCVIYAFRPIIEALFFESKRHKRIYVIWIFFLVFVFNLTVFTFLFHRPMAQHYFHVSIPLFFILFTLGLQQLLSKKKVLLSIIVLLIFTLNIISLFRSQFQFPLIAKLDLVKKLLPHVNKTPFSLYTLNEREFSNNGFTGLFILNNVAPVKSSDYQALDWWYRTQSLYFTTPFDHDPETVVVMKLKKTSVHVPAEFIRQTFIVRGMEGVVIDNSTGWFHLNEVL